MAQKIELKDEWRYAQLATLVEAWGLRAILARGEVMSREEIALAWFNEEYQPVVDALEEAGLGGGGTQTERYLRIAMLRYLLLRGTRAHRRHRAQPAGGSTPPGVEDDTMVHQILKELT